MKVNIWLIDFFLIIVEQGFFMQSMWAVNAEQVGNVLHEFNCDNTTKAILVENPNDNLHTTGSSLHHNEPPFRALFQNIDGCAKGLTAFSGPLGKLCSKDCHDLSQISFPTISRPLDSILKIDEFHDLSCDQRLLYEYAVGISTGRLTLDMPPRKLVL